jgi:putative FmdB family regulatory protein
MPIYEYICVKCGARNEFVESLGRGRITAKKCVECGSARLKKAVSKFAYHPEVTLEDLGVPIINRPAAPMPGGMEQPQGPPPGECPYCGGGEEGTAKGKDE